MGLQKLIGRRTGLPDCVDVLLGDELFKICICRSHDWFPKPVNLEKKKSDDARSLHNHEPNL